MANNARLKKSVVLEPDGNGCVIRDSDTGFVGQGNRYAKEIFTLLEKGMDPSELIKNLTKQYPDDQYDHIVNSVVNAMRWGFEKELLEYYIEPDEGFLAQVKEEKIFSPVIGEKIAPDSFEHVLLSCHC